MSGFLPSSGFLPVPTVGALVPSGDWLGSAWYDQLQPGSWRGVPFVMDTAALSTGRKTAVHEYPYRDEVWVEDLGRKARRIPLQAYLTGDNVYQLRDAMNAACEQPGQGTLIHPTLGTIQCYLIGYSTTDRRERGRYIEVAFEFLVAGDLLFPTALLDTGASVLGSATGLNQAALRQLNLVVSNLGPITGRATGNLQSFANIARMAVQDPTRALNAVMGMVGNYGRFASGSRATSQPALSTVHQLLAQATVQRTSVYASADRFNAATGLL